LTLPATWVALAAPFLAVTAAAQPATTARVPRQRTVSAASASAASPEVRLAPEVRTLVLFDADIDASSLVLDATRVRLVDAGARSLVLQPVTELSPKDRLMMRVRFRGDADPQEAGFVLVWHPSEVDTVVDVTRSVQSTAMCRAELAETQAHCGAASLAELIFSGALDARGVVTAQLRGTSLPEETRRVSMVEGWVHTGPDWGVLALRIRHPPGEPPWTLQEAGLTQQVTDRRFLARTVRVQRTSEAEERVVLEFASPEIATPGDYQLSLSEAPGAGTFAIVAFGVPDKLLRAPERQR
jgi:uncharacterized protein (TIGR02268 family)